MWGQFSNPLGVYTYLSITISLLTCSKTWYPAHFADNQRKALPTATGRSPPSGFFNAISFAPKKYGRSSKGTFPSRITFTRFVRALKKFCLVCPFDLAVKSFKICSEMPSNSALELLGKDMRALWTKNSEVEKQSISVVSGTEQVSLCECFSSKAILSSRTDTLIPALTLASSHLVQMERSRRSNSLFCCCCPSRFGFFSMTPSRIRLLITALSDDL